MQGAWAGREVHFFLATGRDILWVSLWKNYVFVESDVTELLKFDSMVFC